MSPDSEPIYFEDRTHVDVTAAGPLLISEGHLHVLAAMRQAIEPWMRETVANRLIVPHGDARLRRTIKRYDWPVQPTIFGCPDTPVDWARYMLVHVCPQRLAGRGLLVTQVTVRRATCQPTTARHSAEAVLRALEQGPTADAPWLPEGDAVSVVESDAAPLMDYDKKPRVKAHGTLYCASV